MPIFGNDNIESNSVTGQSNYIFSSQYPLSEEGTIESISLYLAVAAGDVRLAIYDDALGVPANLLCETDPVAAVVGWNTLIPTTLPTLPAGDYWIAFQVSHNDSEKRNVSGYPGRTAYRTFNWAAFPDPANCVSFPPDLYSAYATYEAPIVGGYAAVF